MFKSKSKWTGAMLALMMILAFTTPIFAQGEADQGETPEVVEEPSKFLDHPIVKLIAEFFADLFNPPVEEEPEPEVGGVDLNGEDPGLDDPPPGDELLVGDGSTEGEPEPEPEPVIIPEEAVATLHEEENLGFGEIVKLMRIVEDAQAECAETGENCGITLDSLLAERKDGAGMGALFDKYGKPEHLGVGQIKNENAYRVKGEKTNNGKAKGKDK